MKKELRLFTLRRLCTVLVFAITCTTFAQTYENDKGSEDVNGEEIVIDNDNVSLEVFSNLGFDTSFSPNPDNIVGNLVSIQQIGDFNTVNVFSATESSTIDITQEGSSNEIDLRYNTRTVFALLNQQGNFNSITDFVSDSNANPAIDLTQNGNNLSFERYGVNSLTNSLRFTQTEASPAIIVRSYQ